MGVVCSIGFTVVTITFTAASIIHILENLPDHSLADGLRQTVTRDEIGFGDSIYFIVMTITTVGYGDIAPTTTLSKLTIMLMMATVVFTIPRQTNKLVVMLNRQSLYLRSSFHPSKSTQHIVVCGAVGARAGGGGLGGGTGGADAAASQTSGLLPFLWEFHHEDHGTIDRCMVVMGRGQPSQELEILLSHPKYSLGISYLDGDIMQAKDLRRACVESAKGIFVLSNKYCDDVDAEDASTILRALSVKRYVFQKTGRDIMTCVQLIRPQNKRLFFSATSSYSAQVAIERSRTMSRMSGDAPAHDSAFSGDSAGLGMKRVTSMSAMQGHNVFSMGIPADTSTHNLSVCIEELKFSLLAKSCLCPGLPTMIYNLVSSTGDDLETLVDETGGTATDDTDPRFESTSPQANETPNSPGRGHRQKRHRRDKWWREYLDGCSYEIYRVPLSKGFSGVTFLQAAQVVYEETGSILFGLEIGCGTLSEPCVVLNPGHFILPESSRFSLFGFVIAEDKKEADVISSMGIRAATKPFRGLGGLRRAAWMVARSAASRKTDTVQPVSTDVSVHDADSVSSEGNSGEAQIGTLSKLVEMLVRRKQVKDGNTRNDAAVTQRIEQARRTTQRLSLNGPHFRQAEPVRPRAATITGIPGRASGGQVAWRGPNAANRVRASSQPTRLQLESMSGVESLDPGEASGPSAPALFSIPSARPSRCNSAGSSDLDSHSEMAAPTVEVPAHPDQQAPPYDMTMVETLIQSAVSSVPTSPSDSRPQSPRLRAGSLHKLGGMDSVEREEILERMVQGKRKQSVTSYMSYMNSYLPLPGDQEHQPSHGRSPSALSMEQSTTANPLQKIAAEIRSRRTAAMQGNVARHSVSHPILTAEEATLTNVNAPPIVSVCEKYLAIASASDAMAQSLRRDGLNVDSFRDKVQKARRKRRSSLNSTLTSSGAQFIQGHILVCGCGTGQFTDLVHFVKPLRAPHLENSIPIVILHQTPIKPFMWGKLAELGNVWFVRGSPLELHDLYRAGIERASSAVLFTNARPSSDSEQSADMLLDADTICMYRLMCTENPELEVVCELVSRNNVTFLSNHTQDDDTLLLAPPFAAGHVYTPAMLDILLCQAWYNPHIVTIMELLLTGGNAQKIQDFNEVFEDDIGPIVESQMFMVAVPDRFAGRKYKRLFNFLLVRYGILAIGLRRAGRRARTLRRMQQQQQHAQHQQRHGVNGSRAWPDSPGAVRRASLSQGTSVSDNEMAFTYTNPKSDAILHAGDGVFVLSQQSPDTMGLQLYGAGALPTNVSAPPRHSANDVWSMAARGDVEGVERLAAQGRDMSDNRVYSKPTAGQSQLLRAASLHLQQTSSFALPPSHTPVSVYPQAVAATADLAACLDLDAVPMVVDTQDDPSPPGTPRAASRSGGASPTAKRPGTGCSSPGRRAGTRPSTASFGASMRATESEAAVLVRLENSVQAINSDVTEQLQAMNKQMQRLSAEMDALRGASRVQS